MLVSAVIPIYKVEDYIERCANSLFSQTYKNMEFIFVDDCSPDKSIDNLCKTIDGYPDLKDRIRIIRHENNRGSSAARNTGIKESHGDFLFFVDADDYVEENAIELLMAKQKETDSDIISGKALRHFKDRIVEMGDCKYETKEDFVCNLIQHNFDHVLWRRIIRKSLFIDNDIWMKEGVNIAEDWQVITRLAYYAKSVSQIDDIIYNYNSTNENSYMYSIENKLDEKLLCQETESMHIVEHFFHDKGGAYQEAVDKMVIQFYYNYLLRSIKVGNKPYYQFFLSKINSLPTKSQEYIGMNKKLKKIVVGNFRLMSIHYKIRLNPIYRFIKRMIGTNKWMNINY